MSIDLEKEKKRVELGRMKQGIAENQYKILERKADIERIEKAIDGQKARIAELEQEINN